MKKLIKKLSLKHLLTMETAFTKIMVFTSILSISSSIYAYDFEDDGIYYNILSDTEVEVTSPYSGTGMVTDRYIGNIIIPELVSHQDKTYTVTSIGHDAFNGSISPDLNTIVIPSSVTSIRSSAFTGCSNLEWVNIPDNVTIIEGGAFSGCSTLTTIDIPGKVSYIGEAAFSGCSNIKTIKLPNGIRLIDSETFSDCTSLESIEIPNNIVFIGSEAFYNCINLKSITIPKITNSIGNGAFYIDDYIYDGNLKEINSLNPTPPIIFIRNNHLYDYICSPDTYATAVLNVPVGSLEAYQKAEGWKQFKHIQEVDFGGVDGVEEDAVSVSAKDGSIVVSGTDNAMAEVYNLSGQLVYSGTDIVINVPSKGIYIVRVSGQTFKVIL